MDKLTLNQALQRGIEAHKAGQFREADRQYSAILRVEPKHSEANYNMGMLAVDVGKIEAALAFFKTALETDPNVVQFWLSYIDLLIKLNYLADAKTVFDQAKAKGVKGNNFDMLEQRLNEATGKLIKTVTDDNKTEHVQPNILDSLKLNQALKLAKKKIKDGFRQEAKQIYRDILSQFPKNQRAIDGLKVLSCESDGKVSRVQDPPQDQIKSVVNLYSQGQFQQALQHSESLLQKFPNSASLLNIQGALLKSLGQINLSIESYAKALSVKPDYADAYYNMGNAFRDLGKLKEATEAYKKALTIKPDYVHAYYNMGVALQGLGKLKEATEAYKKALTIKPDYADAHNNMGNALKDLGKPEEAIEAYKKALAIKPDYAEAYYNMGIALKDLGKIEEAISAYKKALTIKPDYVDAYYNMGIALKDLGKIEEATEAYKKALTIKPDYADAHNNMGITLKDLGKPEEAIEAYKKALAIKLDYAEAYYNMGIALKDLGKIEEAISAYKKALTIKPDYVEAYNNMGITLKDLGKLNESINAYKKALAIKPDYVEAYNNMGITLKDLGKPEEAIEAYKNALAIKPNYAEAHHNMSFVLLMCGRLKEGFEEYEWRWKTARKIYKKREFSLPIWDGKETLKGKKVLLWSEQGVGDTINWSSRLPFIASQAEHCILECQEKLVPLLTRSFPDIEIQAEDKTNDTLRNDFDFHLPLGSLYKHCYSVFSNNTKPDAFLVPNPVRVKFWRKRLEALGSGPFIGISWKSANMSPMRLPNYASISEWSPIFSIPGVTFINLQYSDFVNDLIYIKDHFGVSVHNFDDLNHYNDLDDVSALCAALDIVVSTKITVPLISSGVGTTTKLANWRQSPWNNALLNPVGPMVELFEKNTLEPWCGVFSSIADDIMRSLA